jgi:beta-N-acetylhexosaminidase
LEKLRQVDLAPFFAVAQAENSLMRPEGLMTSHIRFRGLEGGRFVTTRPISVDSQVLQRLLSLPELAPWREEGGVTLSDGLGVRALRRFYDPSERSFNGRRIAQEAFLAGNDLLLLSQFALSDQWNDHLTNVKSAITFFQEKYESDAAFQALVDESVARILRLKLKLYGGSFTLASVQPQVETIDEAITPNRETVAAIARDAVTLLYPPSSDLAPLPPGRDDRVVIFTDARIGLPCATCDPEPYIPPLKLEQTLVRLYGPDATNQIDPRLIESFTFEDLASYLSEDLAIPTPPGGEMATSTFRSVATALQQADWVIFAMLDVTNDVPQSKAVKHFLAERAGALQGPELVVLAYDAPYYLDATEIGKLSAYYAAYSRVEPFIETSVRMLFGEFAPAGDSPISVSGINYDLLSRTVPDPDQSIAVYYEVSKPTEEVEATLDPAEVTPDVSPSPPDSESTPEPQLEQGDELRLYTDQILDRNGHIVPDGTPIQFIFTYSEEGLEHSETVATRGGVAETAVTLNRTGQLDISVQADPAPRVVALQVTIREGRPATVVTPTPPPTPEPTSTPTPEAEPTAEGSPTPTRALAGEDEQEANPVDGIGVLDLVLALVSVLFVGGSGYYIMRLENEPTGQALRMALWGVSGGLMCYVIYVLVQTWSNVLKGRGGAGVAGVAALVGGFITSFVVWMQRKRYIGRFKEKSPG